MEPKGKTSKVSRACNRCRRQKLKCDVVRPCTLCIRSRVDCITTKDASHPKSLPVTNPDGRKKRRLEGDCENSPCQAPDTPGIPNGAISNGETTIVLSSEESSDVEPLGAPPRKQLDMPGSASQRPSGGTSNGNLPSQTNFGGDSSAMGLTMKVFRFNHSHQVSMTSALPGGRDLDADGGRGSVLLEVHFPPRPVAGALIDSYFDTVHWFMFIIHEPSFRQMADRILSLGSQMMTTSDADFAALLLMVIALGAQYAGKNPHWKSISLTKDYSIDLTTLVPHLIGQVRSYLLDMLEHCQIEAVQTCVLLGTFYIYHGNPNLSWSVLGLAVKTAYALGMHREVDWKGDNILLQVRKRAWGHTYIADTFAAVIYGRPSTVDRNFCDVSHPDECDDTAISMPLYGFLESVNDGQSISKHSYHTHKYVLYDIKAQIISKIYTVRARASFQASRGGIQKLVQVVQSFDRKLKAWHDQLPSFFTRTKWTTGEESPEDVFETLHERLPESQELIKEQLIMQSVALQVLHDYILILLHRPLLEYRISSQNRERRQPLTNDPFPNSFETCVEAALRISHAPAHKFKYHCPMALITMHMFTAGVILCLPATMDPFSALAHKTKGAVVRMIRGFKKLSSQTPVVSQSCTILEELMKVVLSRELELILSPEDQDDSHHDNSESRFGVSEIRPIQQASSDFPTSEHESTLHIPASRISLVPPHSVNSPGTRGTNMPQQTNITSLDYNTSSKTGFSSESFPEAFMENSNSTVSPEAFQASQSYDFIDAVPDVGFNDAFGALEKVIYDFAPSEWMNPAWMHSYEIAEPLTLSSQGFIGSHGQDVNQSAGTSLSYYEMGAYGSGGQNGPPVKGAQGNPF